MIDADKKYWIYIFPFVYCRIKENQAFLYNTLSGENIETSHVTTLDLLKSMHEKNNLGAVCCEGNFLKQNEIDNFILEFCNKKMGNIVDIEQMPAKPIQMMPVLNLQCDIEKQRNFETESMLNLLELNIYPNPDCRQNCEFCNKYFCQIPCCTACGASSESLSGSDIQNILSQIRYGVVGKINIFVGNILLASGSKQLTAVFADFKDIVHFHIHYKNFEKNELFAIFHTRLIVNFPIDTVAFSRVYSEINKEKTVVNFIIESEEQYAESENLIDRFGIEKFHIYPFFTGNNLNFFQENIFIDKEDIFNRQMSMREIFRNQKLNSSFFGVLHIFHEGSIKANPNTAIIGNIKEDKILDLIYREMLDNTAWRKIRDMSPCTDCLYQYLCPSPSNYEFAVGKPNLCHIKP